MDTQNPDGKRSQAERLAKAKLVTATIVLVAMGCILVRIAIINHQMAAEAELLKSEPETRVTSQSPRVAPPPAPLERAVTVDAPAPENSPPTPDVPVNADSRPQVETNATPPAPNNQTGNQRQQEQYADPVAREAMALVGVNPDAEEYWFEAINDPNLSDIERQDLIEDLNENGYSGGDGSVATVEDLPLIARRIQIVEALWPYAMDQNNWDAFQEVYNDLWNMYDRLIQQ